MARKGSTQGVLFRPEEATTPERCPNFCLCLCACFYNSVPNWFVPKVSCVRVLYLLRVCLLLSWRDGGVDERVTFGVSLSSNHQPEFFNLDL